MEFKSLDVAELKCGEVTEDLGLFGGFAAVYGNTDRVGDVVMPGAFANSLKDSGGRVPILWMHDMRSPIGVGAAVDSPGGLMVEGKLAMRVPEARKAWELMKAGVIGSMSIGYDAVKAKRNAVVRELHEIKLWEVSLVTIPANPLASVLGMKAQSVLGAVERVKAAEDGAVDALFDGIADLSVAIAEEEKAGRVLSARNRALVKAAHEAIAALLAASEKEDPAAAEAEASKKQVAADMASLHGLASEFAAFAASRKRE